MIIGILPPVSGLRPSKRGTFVGDREGLGCGVGIALAIPRRTCTNRLLKLRFELLRLRVVPEETLSREASIGAVASPRRRGFDSPLDALPTPSASAAP